MMTEQNTFMRYESPEQYAETFLQMNDARERWREQVHEQEAQIARLDRSTSSRLQGKNTKHEHGSYDPKIPL